MEGYTRITSTEIRDNLADIVNQVSYGKERVIIDRRGKDMGAFIPIEDLELLEAIEDYIDIKEADEAMRDYRENGGYDWEDVKKELKCNTE